MLEKKYRREDKLKYTDNAQTKHKPGKTNNAKNTTKQNYPGSVASYDTRPHAPAHTGFINKLEMNTALNS